MKRAVYAGSFDPLTLGHMWIIEQGLKMFDELIVAIGENPLKKYTFSLENRLDMIRASVIPLKNSDKIVVEHFSNKFLVNYAVERKASFIIRGIRNIADFEFERAIRNINSDFEGGKEITPVFLIPPRELSELSSSFVKGLRGPEGWELIAKKSVTEPVFKHLLELS